MINCFKKTAHSLAKMFPLIMGTIMLVSLFNVLVPRSFYSYLFTDNGFWDPLIGALAGSFSAGTPVVSYIISGELQKNGVGLAAITAFLLAWVTVGLLQMPVEGAVLGKRFTVVRNLSSFVSAIIIAIIIGFILP